MASNTQEFEVFCANVRLFCNVLYIALDRRLFSVKDMCPYAKPIGQKSIDPYGSHDHHWMDLIR
jgi:hypothetical protein